MAHDEALAGYRFNDAANGSLRLRLGHKVCDWYLEFAKPLFASGRRGRDRRDPRDHGLGHRPVPDPAAPHHALHHRGALGRDRRAPKMLVHADWPDYGAELIDAAADREMTWVIGLIDEIRSVRAQMHVPAGLKVQLMQAELDDAGRGLRPQPRDDRPAGAPVGGDGGRRAAQGRVTIAVEGGVFGLPIADLIDVAEEKARLEKDAAEARQGDRRAQGAAVEPEIRRKRAGGGRGRDPREPVSARRGRGQDPRGAGPVDRDRLRGAFCGDRVRAMSDPFGKLAERQMQKALAEGKLSRLEGRGQTPADPPRGGLCRRGRGGGLPHHARTRRAARGNHAAQGGGGGQGRVCEGRDARGQARGHGPDRGACR
jgi:hypothetical protein